MTTTAQIEEELERRKKSSSCPIAIIERCGRVDIGANVVCLRCPTAQGLLERYIVQTGIEPGKLGYPMSLGNKAKELRSIQKTIIGNVITDEFICNLILVFLERTVDFLQRRYPTLSDFPKEDLQILLAMMAIKSKVESFRKMQDPALDQGVMAVCKHLTRRITEEVLDVD